MLDKTEMNWRKFKFSDLKEVKKMKKEIDFNKIPYFETKVIRVKKRSEGQWVGGINFDGKSYKVFKKGKGVPYLKEFPKGNFVNGENLEEMRFPCYCEFDANKGSEGNPSETYMVHGIGRIDKTFNEGKKQYQLSRADCQSDREGDVKISNLSVICETPSLKRLMEIYHIQIRKAKLIIFKEEK